MAKQIQDGAQWRFIDTGSLVAVLLRGPDIVGWICVAQGGTGVVATPRIGDSRRFLFLDEAQRYIEGFLPPGVSTWSEVDEIALTEHGRALVAAGKGAA